MSVRVSSPPSLLPAPSALTSKCFWRGSEDLWLCLSGVIHQDRVCFGFQQEAAGIQALCSPAGAVIVWALNVPQQAGHCAQAAVVSSQRHPGEISDLRPVLLR